MNTVQSNVESVAREFATQRSMRQARRAIDRADFEKLAAAGFTAIGAPVSAGGLWVDMKASTRDASNLVRAVAHGDPSVALVSAMHPAVLSFWLCPGDAPEQHREAWAAQCRLTAESALKGEWWGTITSEPGSGGDVARTKSVAKDDGKGGYLLSGQKHFGSGSGATTYVITSALPEGETEADWFYLDIRDAAWDGSTGMKLVAEWDGHGMAGTQSHAFEFTDYPATRIAWPGNLTGVQAAVGPLIASLFTSVIVGVAETAYERAREQTGRRRESMNPYEQTEWVRIESEMWQIRAALDAGLRAVETKGAGAGLDTLHAKNAIAELAESMTQRICRVVGGGTFHRASPFGAAFEDVRALGFLRPPWGLTYDQLWQRSWQ
ncbi:MAG: acyl-CoA dehydrogenase family protein [Dehalococcoidia bacterium]